MNYSKHDPILRTGEVPEDWANAARKKRDAGETISAEEQAYIDAHNAYVNECVMWVIAEIENSPTAPQVDDTSYQPSLVAEPHGKREYKLSRSEQYAQAVYEALRAKGIAPPIHSPIRRQQDAAALLFRCGFRADAVAFTLGLSKRHVLVLKSMIAKEAKAGKSIAKIRQGLR